MIKKEIFLIKIKKEHMIHEYIYASHPFDVAGCDGYNFPYAFSINDFEPITGKVHQPPPVHQKLLKLVDSFFVHLFLDYMTITPIQYLPHIIILILIRTKYCIM